MTEESFSSIWIVEDDAQIAELLEMGLRQTLSNVQCERFETIDATLARMSEGGLSPECILLDNGLPGRSGIQSIPDLRSASPSSRIVLLTVNGDPDSVLRALISGAEGYVMKASPLEKITVALKMARSGQLFVDDLIAGKVIGQALRLFSGSRPIAETPRELDVARLVILGRKPQEIADSLRISIDTANKHISSLMKKYDVHDRTSLALALLRRFPPLHRVSTDVSSFFFHFRYLERKNYQFW